MRQLKVPARAAVARHAAWVRRALDAACRTARRRRPEPTPRDFVAVRLH